MVRVRSRYAFLANQSTASFFFYCYTFTSFISPSPFYSFYSLFCYSLRSLVMHGQDTASGGQQHGARAQQVRFSSQPIDRQFFLLLLYFYFFYLPFSFLFLLFPFLLFFEKSRYARSRHRQWGAAAWCACAAG